MCFEPNNPASMSIIPVIIVPVLVKPSTYNSPPCPIGGKVYHSRSIQLVHGISKIIRINTPVTKRAIPTDNTPKLS